MGTAADGIEAVRKACSLAPDVILLDLMLPGLDGFAVCEVLRQDPVTAAIPIIILTAWAGELARVSGLGTGADDYVTKPFSPRDLIARVQKLVRPTDAQASTFRKPPRAK